MNILSSVGSSDALMLRMHERRIENGSASRSRKISDSSSAHSAENMREK